MVNNMEMTVLHLTLIIIAFQPTESTNTVHLTEESSSWQVAYNTCKAFSGLLGSSPTFPACQPETCNPETLKGKIASGVDESISEDIIMWLNAYVLRSPVMQYHGCYQVSTPDRTVKSIQYQSVFDENGVLRCSLFCRNQTNVKLLEPGNFILLSNKSCYCFPKETKSQWNKLTPITEISSSRCNLSCPENKNYKCGSRENDAIFSMYKFENFSSEQITDLGQHCFYVDADKQVKYDNCSTERKFICQTFEMTDKQKIKTDAKCNQLFLHWYDAQKTCQQSNSFLQIRQNNCTDKIDVHNYETWHNRFIFERIIWNPDPNDVTGKQCLALKITTNNKYKFVTMDCGEQNQALCNNISEATPQEENVLTSTEKLYSTRSIINDHKVNNESLESEQSLGLILGGTVSAVAVSFMVAIIIGVLVRRKRQQNGNQSPTGSPVYYSAITDNLPVEKNKTGDYTYAEATTCHGPVKENDENVYNHLGENETYVLKKTPGDIYDHTGATENTYDLTNSSTKCNPTTQDQLNVYDETRIIESEYDETSTKAVQSTKDAKDSADIYNHM